MAPPYLSGTFTAVWTQQNTIHNRFFFFFSPQRKSGGYLKHCAIKLLMGNALQLVLAAHGSLTLSFSLTLACPSFLLHQSLFFSSMPFKWLGLLQKLCYADILQGLKSKANFPSRQDSSHCLINLTYLSPCGKGYELQFTNMTDGLKNFPSLLNKNHEWISS